MDGIGGTPANAADSQSGRQLWGGWTNALNTVADNMLGFTIVDIPVDEKKEMEAEKGYSIAYNERGQAFYKRDEDIEPGDDDLEAENEHAIKEYDLKMPPAEIEKNFGLGIRLYFNFLQYLMYANGVLAVISLIVVVPHFTSQQLSNFSGENLGFFDFMFVSSLKASNRGAWWAYLWIVHILALAIGPVFSVKTRKFFKGRKEIDDDERQSSREKDVIPENAQYRGSYKIRLIVSFVCFLISLFVPLVLTWSLIARAAPALRCASANSSDQRGYMQYVQLGLAAGCGAVVSGCNVLWKQICGVFTKFEKHPTYSRYRVSNLAKLVIFKVLSLFMLYLMKYIVEVTQTDCVITVMGMQYFLLFFTEITVGNITELLLPKVRSWFLKRKHQRSTESDASFRPEFDTSEEYLELIYRQYMLYASMSIFPLVLVIGFFATWVELKIDKYRICKVCQKPPRTKASNRRMLVFYLIFMWLLAILTPPAGLVWLSSESPLLCFPCMQYDNDKSCFDEQSSELAKFAIDFTPFVAGGSGQAAVTTLGTVASGAYGLDSLNSDHLTEDMDRFKDDRIIFWRKRGLLWQFINGTYRDAMTEAVENAYASRTKVEKFYSRLDNSYRCKCRPCIRALAVYLKMSSTQLTSPCEQAACYALNQMAGPSGVCWHNYASGLVCSLLSGCRGNTEPWDNEATCRAPCEPTNTRFGPCAVMDTDKATCVDTTGCIHQDNNVTSFGFRSSPKCLLENGFNITECKATISVARRTAN